MTAKDYIDKEVKVFCRRWKGDKQVVTKDVMLKKAQVLEVEENSRTMVIVKDIDKGPGYCPTKGAYIGVKSASGWFRGQNHGEGDTYKVHISQLELLPQDV